MSRKVRSALTRKITAAERETQAALTLAKGCPDEWDGKPVTTFPGKRIYPTPGQLTLEDTGRDD